MTTTSTSVLGQRLRQVRRDGGLTGQQLARRLGCSQSKVSKMETGTLVPSLVEVERFAAVVGMSRDAGAELIQLAHEATPRPSAWRPRHHPDLSGQQQAVGATEARARRIQYFDALFICGVVQTAEFADAVFGRLGGLPARGRDAAVHARLDRQKSLRAQGTRLDLVMGEAALRSTMCSPRVLRRQLEVIAELSYADHMRLGVLPARAPVPALPGHGMTLLDDDLLVAEAVHFELMTEDPVEIGTHHFALADVTAHAAFDAEARQIVAEVIAELP